LVLPLSDSLGLNEQELGALYLALDLHQEEKENPVDLDAVTSSVPQVAAVSR